MTSYDDGLLSVRQRRANLVPLAWAASLLAIVLTHRAAAYPVSAAFTVIPAQSELTITADATVIFPFMDADTQDLEGTIDATLDFGSSGAFPMIATMNITNSAVTHETPFVLNLGPTQTTITGLVAQTTTPNPPAPIVRVMQASSFLYSADAANYLITAVEGDVETTGAVEAMRDLSEEDPPFAGSAPLGTLAPISFVVQEMVGPYSKILATLQLPVDIEDTITMEGVDIHMQLDGHVVAQSTFYVALAGIPGDFDQNGRVNGNDLHVWRTGYGMTMGADAGDGDADGDHDVDGNDFLLWQRRLGTASPTSGALAAPEPNAAVLAAMAAIATVSRLRRVRP